MKVVNGRLGEDKCVRSVTFQNSAGKSALDYAILSTCNLSQISEFKVDVLDTCLSDEHTHICLQISFNDSQENPTGHLQTDGDTCDDCVNNYLESLRSQWSADLKN